MQAIHAVGLGGLTLAGSAIAAGSLLPDDASAAKPTDTPEHFGGLPPSWKPGTRSEASRFGAIAGALGGFAIGTAVTLPLTNMMTAPGSAIARFQKIGPAYAYAAMVGLATAGVAALAGAGIGAAAHD